ncbi:MAG TPA: hypothetical protein PKK31_03605 [Elusimicrobiales bacterium]|nr:hypothetical protein [Elusimicrobiales bacterium]
MAKRRTLKAVSAAASAGAALAGALAAGRDPSAQAEALPPAAAALRGAVAADGSAPELLEPLETLLACAEKLPVLLPPPPLPEPLPRSLDSLRRALSLLADLASGRGRSGAAGQIGAIAAAEARELRLARRAAESDPAGFVENLKFSNIYSGLEDCFFRAEEEAGRLARHV